MLRRTAQSLVILEGINMENVIKIINAVISWPTVSLIVILVFSKQLKKLFNALVTKQASLKLPGNIELSLKDLQENYPKDPQKEVDEKIKTVVSDVTSKFSDKSPEVIKRELYIAFEEQRLANLKLFFKTISYQLLAWLNLYTKGEAFGIIDLLSIEHIPCLIDDKRIGAYCVHSLYEKDAIASEFKRNYWNLKRLSVIEDVDEHNVRIVQNEGTINLFKGAMEEVCRTESEIDSIQRFVDKFYKKEKPNE